MKQPDRPIVSPYLTPRECVAYLRLTSVSMLYRLIREQGLPHGRRGRLYLFDVRKLDRWVENCGPLRVVDPVRRRA